MPRTVETDREDALVELRINIQPDAEPALLAEEVEGLLDKNRRASFWLPSTAYTVGDVILPATLNGHRFRCTRSGTSGTTEPTWPSNDRAKIGDGSGGLQWQEDGPDYKNVFDVRAASYAGCLLHRTKAATLHDVRSSSSEYSESQVYDHWGEVAKQFRPVGIA